MDGNESFIEDNGIKVLMFYLERQQNVDFTILTPEPAAFGHILCLKFKPACTYHHRKSKHHFSFFPGESSTMIN